MQEEVENRTVNLAITTTKLTGRALLAAFRAFRTAHKQRSSKRAAARKEKENAKPVGKQTVRELIGQDQGVTSIDIAKTDLRGFEKYARSYGVDYAIVKDHSGAVPKYVCFFKARDTDAMTAAFNSYSAEILRKEKRPSVLKRLTKLKAYVKSLPHKNRSRDKERSLDR